MIRYVDAYVSEFLADDDTGVIVLPGVQAGHLRDAWEIGGEGDIILRRPTTPSGTFQIGRAYILVMISPYHLDPTVPWDGHIIHWRTIARAEEYKTMPHKILPPDVPPEVQPVKYPDKDLTTIGATPSVLAGFRELGVFTLGQLDAYLDDGGDYQDAKAVGPKRAQALKELHTILRTEWEQTC